MKLKQLFGSKVDQQAVRLMAETNSVKDYDLDAGTLHAESPNTVEAWELKANQQCIDEMTGDYVQFISSTHCEPITIYRNGKNKVAEPPKPAGKAAKKDEKQSKEKNKTALIAAQKEDEELVYLEQGKEGGGPVTWLMVMIAALVLVICIVVAKTLIW